VIPEGDTTWTELTAGEDVVRFYDPTDVFGDLADAVAESFPGVGGDDDDEDDDDEDDEAPDAEGADGSGADDAKA
jgi:hypothetical protein